MRLDGEAGDDGNDQRGDEGDGTQDLCYRQLDGPAGEEDGVRLRQIVPMAAAESEESAEEDEKGDHRRDCESSPLKPKGLPEDGREAERAEPLQIDPIRDGGAAADENQDDKGDQDVDKKAQAPRLLMHREIDGFRHRGPPLKQFVLAESRKNCTARG